MTIELEECREPTIFNSLLICIFVGIFLFIALIYRQTELAMLALLILLVVSATKIWSSMSLYRVRCTIRVNKQRAFPGETLVLETNVVPAGAAAVGFSGPLQRRPPNGTGLHPDG